MDIKVMLGPDALILLRDKNFLVFFSSVHSCLRCH
ncbi:hypothetical protein ACP0HM_10235 [Escherichia coli]